MPSLHRSRRRLFGSILALPLPLAAGCADGVIDETDQDEPEDAEVITSLESESMRADDEEPIVRFAGDAADDEADGAAGEKLAFLLTDSSVIDDLEFEEVGADPSGTEDASAFLENTDFDAESVFLYQERIGECYERRVEYAELNADSLALQFCRAERDASIDCRTEAEEMQATFVRVPFAFESGQPEFEVDVSSSCGTTPPDDAGENE